MERERMCAPAHPNFPGEKLLLRPLGALKSSSQITSHVEADSSYIPFELSDLRCGFSHTCFEVHPPPLCLHVAAQELTYIDPLEPWYFPINWPLAAVCGPTDAALSLSDILAHVPGTFNRSFGRCIRSYSLMFMHELI